MENYAPNHKNSKQIINMNKCKIDNNFRLNAKINVKYYDHNFYDIWKTFAQGKKKTIWINFAHLSSSTVAKIIFEF